MGQMTLIRPEMLELTEQQLRTLGPYLWVFGGTVLALLLSVTRLFNPKWLVFPVTVGTCAIGSWCSIVGMSSPPMELFNGMMTVDRFTNFFNVVFLASAGLTAMLSLRYLDREKLQYPEFYVLTLFSALGMMLMVASLDMIVLFISLELMSLAVYALVGFRRADRRSNEAAMKYFILGAVASAIMLYGVALLYGATQTMNLRAILAFSEKNGHALSPIFILGAWLTVIGFLFKVAVVPFHMWMPDVYEGAPTPVTGFMTTGLKAAAFAAFIRVLAASGYGKGLAPAIQGAMHDILAVCAVLTMVIGNVVALTQTNLKRMLAYSSIAHTGYLMLGMIVAARSDQGFSAVVLYLVVYAVMNMGAFGVLSILAMREDHGLNLHDFAGLSARHPWLALAMAVFLLSMAGVPPTAGFAAKYLLFYSAVQAGEVPLDILGVLCSAVSVYYYLRVLVFMYMREPTGSEGTGRISGLATAVVFAMVVLTAQIGIMPARLVEAARRAVAQL